MKRMMIVTSIATLLVSGAACSGSTVSAKSSRPAAYGDERLDDSEINLWVDTALRLDPRIRAENRITVKTEDGIVKLTGIADNLLEKRYARLEAEKIAGVRGVIDEILLRPAGQTDDQIRNEVVRRLSARPSLHLQGLDVSVDSGITTIKGTVRSLGELKHAELIASEVRGVQEITNLLKVSYQPEVNDDDNRDQIVAALDLDPYLTGLPITVRVNHGQAVLEGTVGNLFERRRAEEDIWRVASVHGVENDIKTDWLRQRGTRDAVAKPSDAAIRQAVLDVLLQDLRIEHPGGIDVTVRDGVVTLTGTVRNWYQQNAIESDTDDVVGVEEVIDLIQIGGGLRDDSLIADEIRLDLSSDYLLADRDIGVKVHSGEVVLSGKAETPYEKQHAEMLAHRVLGVHEVVNDIEIPGQAAYNDTALSDHVRDGLRSNWKTRDVADGIRVTVEEGVATLTGSVTTWSERLEAGRVAERVDGIREVHNQLVVGAP